MKKANRTLLQHICSYGTIILMALLLAADYYIFIIENHFAPAGLNGIATMVQYKTGFSISYMSLLINIPLCFLAYFLVEKEYAVKTLVFTVVYSVAYLVLQSTDPAFLQYNAEGHDTIFPAIISGVISGFVSGMCLKQNASTGGMDLISKYINKIKPSTNFFKITFSLNTLIACASLFVYSDKGTLDYKPVALCITYCFVVNIVGNQIIKGSKTAYKFTVITTHPIELCREITSVLRHGVTKLDAHGAYTNEPRSVLLCVVNKHQLPDFQQIIDKYDHTFSFCEMVNETYGNFKQVRTGRR